jgi:DNA-binding GntR family transcriptional regulator
VIVMSAAMKPIGRPNETLADIAYQRISEALLSGEIEPGERLVMDTLAEQLDISRTPVRDALLRLQREGLVSPAGRRGFVVSKVSEQDVVHLYQAREAVEGYAARRVAEIGGEAIDKVEKTVRSMEGIDMTDPRAVYTANMEIHRTIVEVTGNPTLLELFDQIWLRARGQVAFADYLAHDKRRTSVTESHLPLVEALRAGSDAAFAGMRKHIAEGLQVHRA